MYWFLFFKVSEIPAKSFQLISNEILCLPMFWIIFPILSVDINYICLKGVNGLLESPTGTGKTLCLLCSCLGWLTTRKAQVQSGLLTMDAGVKLNKELGAATGQSWGDPAGNMGVPKIIYASRTHSQLSQVISELKRSSYKFMKVGITY